MRTALTRARRARRRAFRLEGLEGRDLLSHAGLPGVAPLVARPGNANLSTITGQVQLIKGSAGPYFKVAPAFTSFGGHGNARPLGLVFVGVQQQFTTPPGQLNPVTIVNGTGLLETPRGEWINYSYTGTGMTARGVTRFTVSGPITGGTGRFNLAHGTFSATGTAHGDRISLGFVLNPTIPPAPPLPGYGPRMF